jgi:hypothetical protein
MIDDMLIDRPVLDDRMTGHIYLDFLQNRSPEQLDDVMLTTRTAVNLQYD